jgi:hypothetical protein
MNMVAAEGQPFGTFKGTTYEYNNRGQIVVDASGNPKQSANLEYLGSTQPDFLANLGTELTIARFTIRALLDARKGGLFYSGTKLSTEFNGTASTTLLNDRKDFVVENSVQEDGVGGYTTNTEPTNSYSYFRSAPASLNLLDASFLKLRELAVSYNLPASRLGVFKGVTVGLFAKNLKYWVAKENTFADPEVGGVGGASDAAGIETTTTPTSRSFGAQLMLNF